MSGKPRFESHFVLQEKIEVALHQELWNYQINYQLPRMATLLDSIEPISEDEKRNARCERRARIRDETHRNELKKKAEKSELRYNTEKRGKAWIEFINENLVPNADQEVVEMCTRKPLSRKAKGKMWSKTAETYV